LRVCAFHELYITHNVRMCQQLNQSRKSDTPNFYKTTDPKIIAVARAMEPLPEYGKDAAVKDVAEVAELIAHAKANGTDG